MIEEKRQQYQQQLKKKKASGTFGNITKIVVIIVLLISNVLTILVAKVYIDLQYPETVVPERPANVPASAVWHGGSKGGHFYELVDIKDDIYRIRVYFDYGDGELYMDSDFKLEPIAITKDNWHKMSPAFYWGNYLGSYIYLHPKVRLDAISPAYGGWDIE